MSSLKQPFIKLVVFNGTMKIYFCTPVIKGLTASFKMCPVTKNVSVVIQDCDIKYDN